MTTDSERLKACYESIVQHNSNNVEAVHYLAVWHFERQSFHEAKKYLLHLSTLCPEDADVWLCLSACYAFSEDHADSLAALNTAKKLISNPEMDVRVKFCYALLAEKRRDFNTAMEGYTTCLNQCNVIMNNLHSPKPFQPGSNAGTPNATQNTESKHMFLREIRGEILLRMAILKKDMGDVENALHIIDMIFREVGHSEFIRCNALCLKGLLLELRHEYPSAELIYRQVIQLVPLHTTALERLGRVYLRYRETIAAAVQCFFKVVEISPQNAIAWGLLGRCYMATNQYTDAWEAYNKAINLNPNDPHIWNSLGVLYYAFGQCRESLGMLSRAVYLDPMLPEAWYNVGALYDICEQPEDAAQAYARARDLGLKDAFFQAQQATEGASSGTAKKAGGVARTAGMFEVEVSEVGEGRGDKATAGVVSGLADQQAVADPLPPLPHVSTSSSQEAGSPVGVPEGEGENP
eukprot:gene25328-30583_t